ncbi:hypothetical protein BFW01_g11750 [Lasiodiplodia theobromae]|nr:hypothetical protein BFW01_g11750 [Lasiodiplodia theobromae]
MGTRNLTLVYYKGAWHIAQYGQWDGYPEGQGLTVLRFVANPENVSKLKAVIDAGNMLYEPTEEQVMAWHDERARAKREYYNHRSHVLISKIEDLEKEEANEPKVVPSVSRDTCAEILGLVANATEPVPIVKELSFIGDTLFCEWAYVVDLDEGAVEVYAGLYDAPKLIKEGAETRFVQDENFKDCEAFPDLVGKWMLDNLPSEHEFLGWFKKSECRDILGGCDAGEHEN